MTISTQSVASVTRKLAGVFTALVLVLGLATSAQAQQSGGSIRGSVFGADSGTVVEVVDTERGMTKSETTGADGSFRFDGLNTGKYEVRVRQGGNVVDSAVVSVSLGKATTVSMATTAEAIEEIVTTGTRVAALDTSIAESGLVITADALLEMPVQRDLASVALLAPGTSRGDYRFGGSGGNVAFAGSSIAENTSFINGLNTTNFRTGVGFSQVPFEFYDTLQVKTGGYSAKYGRSTGGVMNARSKSGTNEWDFGLNVYYETETDSSPETYLSANDLDEDDTTNLDVFVSGPILKDRLFFYALYSDNAEDQRYAGLTSERDFDYEVDEGFWGVKLDGYITDNHHIEYTAFSDTRDGIEATFGFDAATQQRGAYLGDTTYKEGGDNWVATYTGDLTDSFQVSVSYGENEANRTTESATASEPVVYIYDGGFNAVGNWTSFFVEQGSDTREMTRVDLNWVVGDHDLSFGYDNETNTAINFTVPSGGVYWLLDPFNTYNGCTPAECPSGANVRRRNYASGGSFETTSDAFYIQDVWTLNDNWTFELGLRNETFENLNGEGNVFVEVKDQWAPRLAAVWDPAGDGRSKFFANYGLYYLPIAANTNIRMSGGETYIHDYYDWDGVSVNAGDNSPTNLGSLYETVVFGNGEVPDTRSVTDMNIDAMYQSEIILGYQRYMESGWELGVKGIYRNLETTIEDIAIDAAVIEYYNNGAGSWDAGLAGGDPVEDVFTGFHQYVLTNPGNDMSVYIPEQEEQIMLTAAQLNYPKAERQYGAIEFTFAKPFDGSWGLTGSYTWSHSWGNHEGYVKSDNGQDDAGITQNFDQPGLTDFSYGNLPNDRRHTIKMFGSYQLESGLRFGSNFFWQSGRPLSCFGVHPTDVFAADYQASSHFCDNFGVENKGIKRGSLGTTPDIMTIDLSAQYEMEMGRSNVLFTLDVFNIFDSQNATQYNEDGETGGGEISENYGKIIQFQQPRTVRLSARLRF